MTQLHIVLTNMINSLHLLSALPLIHRIYISSQTGDNLCPKRKSTRLEEDKEDEHIVIIKVLLPVFFFMKTGNELIDM